MDNNVQQKRKSNRADLMHVPVVGEFILCA